MTTVCLACNSTLGLQCDINEPDSKAFTLFGVNKYYLRPFQAQASSNLHSEVSNNIVDDIFQYNPDTRADSDRL